MDERFLDRVLRTIPVAQDEPRDREQPVPGGRREDLEGLVIAAPCLFHEIALHRISTGRAAGAALTDYDARWVINRSRIGPEPAVTPLSRPGARTSFQRNERGGSAPGRGRLRAG